MSRTKIHVRNDHRSTVERAGVFFPPRKTTEADISTGRLLEIKACRYLTIVDAPRDADDAGDGEDGQEGQDDGGYESMKLEELRDECADRGLATSGNKAELVDRLQTDDAGDADDAGQDGDG